MANVTNHSAIEGAVSQSQLLLWKHIPLFGLAPHPFFHLLHFLRSEAEEERALCQSEGTVEADNERDDCIIFRPIEEGEDHKRSIGRTIERISSHRIRTCAVTA